MSSFDFSQPLSDNYFVARSRTGQYVLMQKEIADGQERLKRVAYIERDVALRANRMLADRRIRMQHQQNFIRLAKDPSRLAMTATGLDLIQAFNAADVKTQLRLASRRPELIRFLAKPSEAVLLAAVEVKPTAIRYIKNPTEKVQLAAVSRDGMAVGHIASSSQTEKVLMAAVRQNGLALGVLKNSSKEVQQMAVEQNSDARAFLKPRKQREHSFER